MVAINKGNAKKGPFLRRLDAKKGLSLRSFQPQFRKTERCTGCLPNAAGWARGHLEVIKSITKPKSSKSEKVAWKRDKKRKKKGR